MILVFYILRENGDELLQKFFVEKSHFSDLQIKTIMNSTSRLLNIVKLTSKSEKDYYTKIFTIINLWFRIVKYRELFYIFITTTTNSSNKNLISFEKVYLKIIKKIDELFLLCTSEHPHFDIDQNQYFLQNTENLLNQFNKHLIKLQSEVNSENQKYYSQKINTFFEKSTGKYLIIGPGSAGKSSIIAQFVSNWDQNKLENIRPTINKEILNYNDTLLDHNFNLVDLGGQVQYTELHLKDSNLFKNIHTLIYVIDVQDIKKVDFTKNYLLDITSKLLEQNEKPYISIFLHKFDPEIRFNLYANVQDWIKWIEKNIGNSNLDYSYFLTSIKDESARESFARTLLLTLPYWFLTMTIKEDLIIRSLNSLSPIILELKKQGKLKENKLLEEEIFRQSILFGLTATKIIIKKWITHLMNDKKEIELVKSSNEIEDMKINFNKGDSVINMQFKCPLLKMSKYSNLTNYSSICEITHGIITGLAQFINLGSVNMVKTQIRNKTEFCFFSINL